MVSGLNLHTLQGDARCGMGATGGAFRPFERLTTMKIEQKGNVLLIEIDVSKVAFDAAIASASGKTKIVDSTHGFTGVVTPGGLCQLSLNLTRK